MRGFEIRNCRMPIRIVLAFAKVDKLVADKNASRWGINDKSDPMLGLLAVLASMNGYASANEQTQQRRDEEQILAQKNQNGHEVSIADQAAGGGLSKQQQNQQGISEQADGGSGSRQNQHQQQNQSEDAIREGRRR